MATVIKKQLSGSTDGLPINLSATVAQQVHVAFTSTNTIDEIFLWATNSSTVGAVTVTIEINASGSQSYAVDIDQKAAGPQLIMPGFPIVGKITGGYTISAQASASGMISIFGYVNRITQS